MALSMAILLFIFSALVILLFGIRLTKKADQLADITGMGEALVGAIFLGAVTSLSGSITSITAALSNHPNLAISNAIGGIAVQTAFLSIADIAYLKANLEHAAASLINIMQAVLLIILLAFCVLISFSPKIEFFGIHPASIILIIIYVSGIWSIKKYRKNPMWKPLRTKETVEDFPEKKNKDLSLRKVLAKFIFLAVIVSVAGYMVAKTGVTIAQATGLSETVVGTLFTAVATSLPELVVTITAVREKALTLAVGNIIGGNTFDILMFSMSDFAYRGSIFHTLVNGQYFLIILTILLTSILLLGLLIRQKKGMGKIGWESWTITFVYIAGIITLFFI